MLLVNCKICKLGSVNGVLVNKKYLVSDCSKCHSAVSLVDGYRGESYYCPVIEDKNGNGYFQFVSGISHSDYKFCIIRNDSIHRAFNNLILNDYVQEELMQMGFSKLDIYKAFYNLEFRRAQGKFVEKVTSDSI